MSEKESLPYQDIAGKSELYFGFTPDFSSFTGEMEQALDQKDVSALLEISGDNQARDQMILTKGPEAQFLYDVLKMGDVFSLEVNGVGLSGVQDVETLSRVIQELQISPRVFLDIARASYHLGNFHDAERFSRLVLELPDEILPALIRADTMNTLASTVGKAGKFKDSFKLNNAARDIVRRFLQENPSDQNAQYLLQKLLHGLIFDQSRQGVKPEHIDSLRDVVRVRYEIGDMAHVGRGELDIAKFLLETGETDEALVEAQKAYEHMMQCKYISGAVHAADLNASIRKEKYGEFGRARRIWIHGVELGKTIQPVLEQELERMVEKAEIRIPARVLIEVAPDKFLVSFVKEEETVSYSLPLFEQGTPEGNNGGMQTILMELTKLLRHIASSVMEGKGQEIEVSRRKDGVFVREKPSEGEKNPFFSYKVELRADSPFGTLVQGENLDKLAQIGYGILSGSELESVREMFDPESQRLLAIEMERKK